MIAKSLKNLRINTLSYSELVLVCPCESVSCLDDLFKLFRSYVTDRAFLWWFVTFVDISTNQTSVFLYHNSNIFNCCLLLFRVLLFFAFGYLYKIFWSYAAKRALLRSCFTFMYITANYASVFLCHNRMF